MGSPRGREDPTQMLRSDMNCLTQYFKRKWKEYHSKVINLPFGLNTVEIVRTEE